MLRHYKAIETPQTDGGRTLAMMSLEDVKVGDRVWRAEYEPRQGYRWLETVSAVTPNYIRLEGHENDTWYRSNGWPRGRAEYWLKSIATPAEITAWEAEQAQQQADAEAAEREREQAREEKRERLAKLTTYLGSKFRSIVCDPDALTFTVEYDGHRYEIREVEAHREE